VGAWGRRQRKGKRLGSDNSRMHSSV